MSTSHGATWAALQAPSSLAPHVAPSTRTLDPTDAPTDNPTNRSPLLHCTQASLHNPLPLHTCITSIPIAWKNDRNLHTLLEKIQATRPCANTKTTFPATLQATNSVQTTLQPVQARTQANHQREGILPSPPSDGWLHFGYQTPSQGSGPQL